MLNKLYIRNFLYIESLDLDFKNGLSIFTGETGSGKSLILKTINFCLGEKLPNHIHLNSGSSSVLLLEFDINNNQKILDFLSTYSFNKPKDNILLIKREIIDTKKSKFFLNDIPITLQLLKQLSENLLEYQGQHSQLLLLNDNNHLKIVDQYAGLSKDLDILQRLHLDYQEVLSEIKILNTKKLDYEKDLDYQRHTLEELQNLAIEDNEENNLKEIKQKTQDSQKLKNQLKQALELLDNDQVEQNFVQCYKLLLACDNKYDLDFTHDLQEMDELTNKISNLISSVKSKQRLLSEDINLEKIEDRLDLIRTIARKHRVSSTELSSIMLKAEQFINDVSNIDNYISDTEVKLKNIREDYYKLALAVSDKRKEAALSLESKIMHELKDLNMAKTILKIDIKTDPTKLTKNGFDNIEFLSSNNPGTPLAPLKNISSGGELSRLILAMKVVLSIKDAPETIIFDEIDSGLGGAAAAAVGEKLLLLSKKFQLILVTHHQQVASKADSHYLIKKQYHQDTTYLVFETLDRQARLYELARMISGKNITPEALDAAAKLLDCK